MISLGSKIVNDWLNAATWEADNGTPVIDVAELKEVKDVMIISVSRYKALDEAEDFLNALKAAGVDNWEGYGFAQDILSGEA